MQDCGRPGGNSGAFCGSAGLRRASQRARLRPEIIAPGYTIAWLPAATPQGEVEVMAFVGDPACESMEPDLPRARQVRYVATGEGFLGSSLEYCQTILAQFGHMGIREPELETLVAEAAALAATMA